MEQNNFCSGDKSKFKALEAIMGQASKKLLKKLLKMPAPIVPLGRGRTDIPDIKQRIKEGLDPVHAAYIYVQNISSYFSEAVSPLPEMKKYAKIVGNAEDEYMPSGPPMSPLTRSYFTCWAFFDLQFDGIDTLASCLIEAKEVIGMGPDHLDALVKMSKSRMGFYENVGREGNRVRLRELLTDEEFVCHCTSGYQGEKGELWYVRRFPPLMPEVADYHVIFTTPYILIETAKRDWTQFLERSLLSFKAMNRIEALNRLLKHGPDLHYWNEFVFKAYCNHQFDAIFLAGIPDMEETLPHA